MGCRSLERLQHNHASSGFYCSCHGSKYDLAGRVFKGVPAPINMQVPNYAYINDGEILIGVDEVPKHV